MSRRFYKKVSVKKEGDGYSLLLDTRTLKTPGKIKLGFMVRAQAECVASEWRAQGDNICPDTMPCTRLMNVARELTPERRPDLCEEFQSYCQTDLLCFRSHSPEDLFEKQEKIWQPVLDWAAEKHAINLVISTGIKTITHPSAALTNAAHYAGSLDDVKLTLLLHFTSTFGSGVLALAVLDGHMSVKAAFAASRLDEIFQNERWGKDDEAVQRTKNIGEELEALSGLLQE